MRPCPSRPGVWCSCEGTACASPTLVQTTRYDKPVSAAVCPDCQGKRFKRHNGSTCACACVVAELDALRSDNAGLRLQVEALRIDVQRLKSAAYAHDVEAL